MKPKTIAAVIALAASAQMACAQIGSGILSIRLSRAMPYSKSCKERNCTQRQLKQLRM
jgi:hypothetical protein